MRSPYRRVSITVLLYAVMCFVPWSWGWCADVSAVSIPLPSGERLPVRYFLPAEGSKTPLPGIIVAAPAGAAKYVQYHTYCSKLADRNYAVLLFDAANLPEDCTICSRCWRRIPYNILAWKNNILVALRLGFGYEWYLQTVRAASEYWFRFPAVDPERVAISGFSQSANAVLSYAAQDPRIKGVVWNSGGWPWIMPYRPGSLPPVLIFHGADDGVYNVRYARRLAAQLKNAGRDCECYVYPGQRHLFNIYYDLDVKGSSGTPAITSSFQRLLTFCDRVLKAGL